MHLKLRKEHKADYKKMSESKARIGYRTATEMMCSWGWSWMERHDFWHIKGVLTLMHKNGEGWLENLSLKKSQAWDVTTHHNCLVGNSWFITEPPVPPRAPLFARWHLPGNPNFLWTSMSPHPALSLYYLLARPSLILHIGLCSLPAPFTFSISLSRALLL